MNSYALGGLAGLGQGLATIGEIELKDRNERLRMKLAADLQSQRDDKEYGRQIDLLEKREGYDVAREGRQKQSALELEGLRYGNDINKLREADRISRENGDTFNDWTDDKGNIIGKINAKTGEKTPFDSDYYKYSLGIGIGGNQPTKEDWKQYYDKKFKIQEALHKREITPEAADLWEENLDNEFGSRFSAPEGTKSGTTKKTFSKSQVNSITNSIPAGQEIEWLNEYSLRPNANPDLVAAISEALSPRIADIGRHSESSQPAKEDRPTETPPTLIELAKQNNKPPEGLLSPFFKKMKEWGQHSDDAREKDKSRGYSDYDLSIAKRLVFDSVKKGRRPTYEHIKYLEDLVSKGAQLTEEEQQALAYLKQSRR